MKSFLMRTVFSIVGLVLICLTIKPSQEPAITSRVVTAANAFLSTLDEKQRKSVLYSFDDEEQRKRWSNFPTGFVPRGGISLKEMSATQQAAAMDLMAIVLSPMGLEKVNQIRLADDDFKANGSKRGPRGGGPPGGNGGRPPQFANGGPPPPGGGPGAVRHLEAEICSERISTTSRSLVILQRRRRGCFNLAVITWR